MPGSANIAAGARGQLPPAVEAFGRTPQIAEVELSPSGERIAWIDQREAQARIIMLDLASGRTIRADGVDAATRVRSLTWSDDATLLVEVSRVLGTRREEARRYEDVRTLVLDAGSGPVRTLLVDGGHGGARLLAWRTAKPKTVVLGTFDFSLTDYRQETGSRLAGGRRDAGWVASVFAADTQSGGFRLIAQGTPYTVQWAVDQSGNAVARSEWDAERREYRVLVHAGRGWRQIHFQDDGEQLALCGLDSRGKAVVALGANGQGRAKVWALPLDGSGGRVLLEHPSRDIAAVLRDGFTGVPVGARVSGPEREVRWFDGRAKARHESVQRAFPGRDVEITSRSANGRRLLVRVESASQAPVYYLVDFGAKRADIVGEEYPQLQGVALGAVQPIAYAARDGVQIPAYLTLPPGAEPKGLPLVVLVHGGPESRDESSFNWWTQFLATRGYVVLQPQFRGSTGLGEAHRLAGYRQWGGRMQDDVTDGVRSLIERGIVDARRVCVAGASYGGYAALAGAAFTPELYACAVSVNGIADLPGMINAVEQRAGEESDSLAYWRDHIGSPLDPAVAARSPTRSAETISAPVLLLHGTDDTVVPIAQSKSMARALEKAGRPHALVQLPGEDHWLSRSETRVRMLAEMEKFLEAHLGAGASANASGAHAATP